ncbi:MAG: proline--tRNA ligase, partial [Armatimonadetes bacterium]|nr:proline--tRNA ligase [Armatimonadota bacterium]
GFAMECAVVTHSGLQSGEKGLEPKGKLEEPLIVRPTSETVIGAMFAQWVNSYRDLPLLINQWANVMRWELRTRLFLRTAEFLWQEGHTAHETEKEAIDETLQMLDVYAEFAREFLAVPVIKGRKTDSEKFAGAVTTYCIESLMQDNKALQAGTSHFLGQNFAKAFDVKFQGRDQQVHHVWTTSWGMSTRLIGALVMTHSDDEGVVLPPKMAPTLAAVIPIYKTDEEKERVTAFARQVMARICGEDRLAAAVKRDAGREFLRAFTDDRAAQSLVLDLRNERPGEKHFYWEQRGAPFRIEVGPRDVDNGAFVLKTRLDGSKSFHQFDEASPVWLAEKAEDVQKRMLARAEERQTENTREVSTYDELKAALKERGGFIRAWFNPSREIEAKIKEETKGTVRVIPFEQSGGTGKDVCTGEKAREQVLFAIAY